jgi:hypothetical protein
MNRYFGLYSLPMVWVRTTLMLHREMKIWVGARRGRMAVRYRARVEGAGWTFL